jgi:hypothetical protein
MIAFHSVEHLAGPGARGAFPEAADEDERQAKISGQVKELSDQGINVNLKVWPRVPNPGRGDARQHRQRSYR